VETWNPAWNWETGKNLLLTAGLLLGALAVGLVAHKVLLWLTERSVRRLRPGWAGNLPQYIKGPSRVLLPLFFINLILPSLKLSPYAREFLTHVGTLLFIAAMAYLCISLIHMLRDLILARHDIAASDNLLARKAYTRIRVLEKSLQLIVAIATGAFMLMTFDGVRQVGVSILASAGIAGIILGLAAQKSLGNLMAGIQIAITQPIRIDDAVIVEGEFGNIEEINLTYVVVRLWDLRRLVIPINWFIENAFQNWTRTSTDLLGTVEFYTDYGVPVEDLRAEAKRVVESSELWDKKVFAFQVTECRPECLQVRVLLSASSSGRAFDLRCFVREKMVAYLDKNHKGSLPILRAHLTGSMGTDAVSPPPAPAPSSPAP
jgi:small-conductance mechanosensitive channel